MQTFSALLGHILRVLQGDEEQWNEVQQIEEVCAVSNNVTYL